MSKLPKIIASSVIRSSHQGQSHGGVYIIDLETRRHSQVVDWNSADINWEGRGLDRGLRGIGIHDQRVYMAASDEIFVYDENFTLIESHRNPYLRHCHETFIHDGRLYLSSTGFDSVLAFDLLQREFTAGYCFRVVKDRGAIVFAEYDPRSNTGPDPGDTLHLNNVHCIDETLFFSCLKHGRLMYIRDGQPIDYAPIPIGNHNARPYQDGVLVNDTAGDRLVYLDRRGNVLESFSIPRYPEEKLMNNTLPKDHARQAFARGLCVSEDGLFIVGSSPATVSVYELGRREPIESINLTLDVRNTIHGLEIWPFDN